MHFLLAMTVFSYTLSYSTCSDKMEEIHIEGKEYWRGLALSELNAAVGRKLNEKVAKNVIIFVGDGMGVSTVTAARIYDGQVTNNMGEAGHLSFETFPITGLSKTYSTNKQTADSAATGTAMFTGVKTNQKVIGLDMQVSYRSCDLQVKEKATIKGLMSWGQDKGKHTGIVTTTRVTHATPAATFAHISDRDWECDSQIPAHLRFCVKDIARQLVEDSPGSDFKVILGGGRRQFGNLTSTSDDSCFRSDGRNLVNDWRKNKLNATFVATKGHLEDVDTKTTDYLLGLFADGHMSYSGENDITRPPLKLMTQKAIEILSKSRKGYFLMVEGGKIDIAHHENYAKLSLMETVELSEAVSQAISMVNLEDTLIIVTADHSHPFTLSGYTDRGADILGFADTTDNSFYQTLSYSNGPGFATHHIPIGAQNCTTSNWTKVEAASGFYFKDTRRRSDTDTQLFSRAASARFLELDTHGGEDVAIYAQGPKAHLFSGVHEQNYIAHAISCAACVGPHEQLCCGRSSASTVHHILLSLSLMQFLLKFLH